MTKEMLKVLKDWMPELELAARYNDNSIDYQRYSALDMAIQALEQQPCEDCISRQAVLDEINRIGDTAFDGYNDYSVFFEFIDNLPSVTPKMEWTPVSERLPKAGEYIGDVAKYYLVQNEYGDMMVARFTHSEYWEQIYQLKTIADKIVAWKPLPEPYKAESECNKKKENPLTNSHFMTRFMRVD